MNTRPSFTKQRRRRSRVLFVLVILAVTVPVSEILVRVLPLEAFALEELQLDSRLARYDPHPYLSYVLKPNWSRVTTARSVSHNSLGYRGFEFERAKPNGLFRIVCLGGSSTYGQGPTRDATAWPAQLQGLLNSPSEAFEVQVINAGAPGYTSYESLVNLALRVIDLEPDLVLVYHGFNDQRFWFRRGVQPDNSHARAVWPQTRSSWFGEAMEHSRLFLVARRYLTDFGDRRRLAWWTVKDFGDKSARLPNFQAEGPSYFARNLEHMVALCRSRNIALALGIQAYFRDDIKIPAEHKGMAAARETISAVASELNVPLLDLDTALGQQRELFVDAVHLSDAGAAMLAEQWAAFLNQQQLVEAR